MSERILFGKESISKSAEFHSAILTTYSFDFHHFESQVLRRLKSSGVTNVNVFADTNMLDKSIGYATAHLKSLSTAYSIVGIPCTGAFHPKITLLVGENDILLIQGSGNITNGGHGKNHELFGVFYANEEDQTQLPLIQEAWSYIKRLTNKVEGIASDKLDWVSDNCNLLTNDLVQPHQFYQISDNFSAALLYNEETSIWRQLQELNFIDEIKNIKIFSPFYDEKGTFLKRFSEYFSGVKVESFLQPEKGIHPHKMSSNKNISFLSWDSTVRASEKVVKYDRKLHSKIFWFNAGDEEYCLFGSPNATNPAFGTDTSRGANDEFAVLIKVKNLKILEVLNLSGEYETIEPQEIKEIQAIENENEEERVKGIRKVKLLAADQDGKNLTIFLNNPAKYETAVCVFYNHWSEELERQKLDVIKNKIRLELKDPKVEHSIAYVQLIDKDDNALSNKQIVNSLLDLWNTNPSVENRKLMKLSSLIELGKNKIFDVINFFNDIKPTSTNLGTTSRTSRGNQEDEHTEKPTAANLTYEEAIALNKETVEHQRIIKQHNSIRIWDSIEKYFKELAIFEEEEDMDDEEEGNATTSRQRKDKKARTEPIPLNSEKVVNNRRKSIEKFLNNYLIALQKSLGTKDHQIGLIDLAMFMIAMKQLILFTEREVILKVTNPEMPKENLIVYPLLGNLSKLDSFAGAILNLVGNFVNLLFSTPFQEAHDDFTEKKLERYKILVRRTALFSLAIIHEQYKNHENGEKWSELLALNIIDKLGEPEKGFNKHLGEFLKNTSIKGCDVDQLTEQITYWIQLHLEPKRKPNFHFDDKLGICYILKMIPNEGPVKFLKLGRPGFEYNHDLNEFILPKLYNFKTGELNTSLQKFKKSKLVK